MLDEDKRVLRAIGSGKNWIHFNDDKQQLETVPKPPMWFRWKQVLDGKQQETLRLLDHRILHFLNSLDLSTLVKEDWLALEGLWQRLVLLSEKQYLSYENWARRLVRLIVSLEQKPEGLFVHSLNWLESILIEQAQDLNNEIDGYISHLTVRKGLFLQNVAAQGNRHIELSEHLQIKDFYHFIVQVCDLSGSLDLSGFSLNDWEKVRELVDDQLVIDIFDSIYLCGWNFTHPMCRKSFEKALALTSPSEDKIQFLSKYLLQLKELFSQTQFNKDHSIAQLETMAERLGEDFAPRNVLANVFAVVGFDSLSNLSCDLVLDLLRYYENVEDLIREAESVGDSKEDLNLLALYRVGNAKLSSLTKGQFYAIYRWYKGYAKVWKIYVKDPSACAGSVYAMVDQSAKQRYNTALNELSLSQIEDFCQWSMTYQDLKEYLQHNPDELEFILEIASARYGYDESMWEDESRQLASVLELLHALSGDEFRAFLEILQRLPESSA